MLKSLSFLPIFLIAVYFEDKMNPYYMNLFVSLLVVFILSVIFLEATHRFGYDKDSVAFVVVLLWIIASTIKMK